MGHRESREPRKHGAIGRADIERSGGKYDQVGVLAFGDAADSIIDTENRGGSQGDGFQRLVAC